MERTVLYKCGIWTILEKKS